MLAIAATLALDFSDHGGRCSKGTQDFFQCGAEFLRRNPVIEERVVGITGGGALRCVEREDVFAVGEDVAAFFFPVFKDDWLFVPRDFCAGLGHRRLFGVFRLPAADAFGLDAGELHECHARGQIGVTELAGLQLAIEHTLK